MVCVNETMLDDFDTPSISIDGFEFWSRNRRKFSCKSGGVGVFGKSELIKHNLVTRLTELTTSGNTLWFKIHKELCGYDIICGACYVEPEESKYTDLNVFENIEYDLMNYVNDHVLLISDLNCRTGVLNDMSNDGSNMSDVRLLAY